MKRRFLQIINQLGLELVEFKSERSDMGFQCFEITVKAKDNECYSHETYYAIGSGEQAKQESLDFYKKQVQEDILNNQP